jgi:hypothetical protein
MKTAPGFGRGWKNAGLPEWCDFLHFRTSGSAMGGERSFVAKFWSDGGRMGIAN